MKKNGRRSSGWAFFSVRHPRLPARAMRNCRIIDAWCCADQIFKVHSGGLGRQSALKWNGRSPASRMCQVRKQKGWRKGRPAVICQSVGGRRVVQTSTGNQAEAGGDSRGVLASLLPCSLLSLCATLFPLHQMTAPIFLLYFFSLSWSQTSPNRHVPSDMFSCTSLYLLVWPTQSQTPQGAVSDKKNMRKFVTLKIWPLMGFRLSLKEYIRIFGVEVLSKR